MTDVGELSIPRARVKRVMKADDDVDKIKPEALLLITKATELFVGTFARAGHANTRAQKRKVLSHRDLVKVVQEDKEFDFLTDLITERRPGSDNASSPKRHKSEHGSASASHEDIWLPQANVKRVVKIALGAKVTCEADASKDILRAATIFISYLTACAYEFAQKKKSQKALIAPMDVFSGVDEIGHKDWRATLEQFLIAFGTAEKKAGGKPKEKRAASGFIKYSVENREQVKQGLPEATLGEIAKVLGRQWQGLTAEEKASYKAVKEVKSDA